MAQERETEASKRAPEPGRIWNGKFITLLVINLCIQMGNYMLRPIVSNYVIELGATLTVAGVVAGMAFAVATLMRPVTGYLADRLHKKTSLLIALVAFTVSSFGCALFQSIALVGICCAVQGVALSFQAIGLMSMATLCVPRPRIGAAVGWMGIIMTVTMAVGPGLTASIAAWSGYRTSFAIGGALCLTGLIILMLFKAPPGSEGRGFEKGSGPAQPEGKPRLASMLRESFHLPTVPIAVAVLLGIWAPSSVSILLLTVEDTGYLTGVSWYFLVYAVVALGSRPLAGWLSDRTRSAIIAVPLYVIGAIGMLVPVFWHDFAAVIVCGVLMGLGPASAFSVVQAESVRGVDAEHLGRATNTYYLGVDLGCALGAWAGGFLMQVGTPALMFGFDALACLAAAGVIAVMHARRRRK